MALRADDRFPPIDQVQRLTRDERQMRVVEWLVAGGALLASLLLSLPR